MQYAAADSSAVRALLGTPARPARLLAAEPGS